MNTLKQHISKSLGIYENFYEDFHNENEQEIIGWITENYNIGRNKLQFEQTDGAYIVNCNGVVEVKNKKIVKLTEGFVWGEVKTTFDCGHCPNLTSLDGAPTYVKGNFDCSYCKSLTSLEGSPEKVGGDFICVRCGSLKSIEGAPKNCKIICDKKLKKK